MRVCLWHGWLLEGSGSNVYTAKVAEVLRRNGHDVMVVCQEAHPDRFGFVDAWASVGPEGVGPLRESGVEPAAGRAVLLRPEIGSLLPVFVIDEYEGFEVKRFVDLTDAELAAYLDANARALAAALTWHRTDLLIAGHAIPGPVVAARSAGPVPYVAKIHGSDLEYAVQPQRRYADLAREGLEPARAVAGTSDDVLARLIAIVPSVSAKLRKIAPGVQIERFHPAARRAALLGVSALLDGDPETERGRPSDLDAEVRAAIERRDGDALLELAHRYDQAVPDPEAASRLRDAADHEGLLVGYFGKFILPKGVERFIEALALLGPEVRGLAVGFGLFREWLAAMTAALDRGDAETVDWVAETSGMQHELTPAEVAAAAGLGRRLAFTGRLDHRYAPAALAALDVLVVPSTLSEAFGMVAAEGAAAGALPLVARHSGLAEVAATLESAVGRPGLFSFEPGPGATHRIAEAIRRITAMPQEERRALRAAVSSFVASEWTWERTTELLLEAARDD